MEGRPARLKTPPGRRGLIAAAAPGLSFEKAYVRAGSTKWLCRYSRGDTPYTPLNAREK